MKLQIGELERLLREERGREQIRLSVIYRDDALGQGTRVGLNSLELNGKTLVENGAANPRGVSLEAYDPSLAGQEALVARQVEFAPDIVVLGGTAEAIEQIMVPLERWFRGPSRPHYILIDSLRGPELLQAIGDNDDLRRRVRGTGIVPTERSQEVYDAFRIAYQTAFPGQSANHTGMGPSYDAVHAIAYALAATRAERPSGKSIARGLRFLADGELQVPVQRTKILSAFRELSAGRRISALGSFGPLAWDERGAVLGGAVEVWCVRGGAQPNYGSSGLTFDLASMMARGSYRPCSED